MRRIDRAIGRLALLSLPLGLLAPAALAAEPKPPSCGRSAAPPRP